ncbi:hypothetical protein OG216_24855 [Streptomycetaceae bacterium NBC_01309]
MAAGVLAVNAGIGVAAYAKQAPGDGQASGAPAGCALKPNPHQSELSEERACFSVDASLDRAPAVGETAAIRFTVTAERAAKNVRVEAELPAGLTWATAPVGLTVSTAAHPGPLTGGTVHRAAADGSFKAGEVRTYEGKVTAAAPGSTEIRVRAGRFDAGRFDVRGGGIGEDTVFLSIGGGAQVSAFGVAAAPGEGASTPHKMPGPYAVRPVKQVPAGARPPGPNDDRPWVSPVGFVPGTACVTGNWTYVDQAGDTRFLANGTVEVWDADTDSAHDRLVSGTTDSAGWYRLCFPNTDPDGQDVYVKVITANSRWTVQKTGTTGPYVFVTRTVGNVAKGSVTDFGALKPADPALMRAFAASAAANDLWTWLPGTCWDPDDTVCRPMVVNWIPGGTGGTFYRGDLNQVFLNGTEPDAKVVVSHEMAHALMDDVYEDQPPPIPNCNPHRITARSSTGCAWVEGFAEWIPASVYDDPHFRWSNGASLNLETPNASTTGWDDGDDVEGRVAGALIDVSDHLDDGQDTYGEGDPGNIWKTVVAHKPKTFREFWDARKADGFNTVWPGALRSVYQNAIDYR